MPLAKNALRKLRTLRHPGVVRVLESVETDTYIYIATERVSPLRHLDFDSLLPETVKWGLWSVAVTLKFINEEAASIHGNVRIGSVFVGTSGEWKLAGFEVLSSLRDEDPFIYRYGGLLPDGNLYAAPEIGKGGWDGLKSQPVHAADAWGLGVLIYECFNISFAGTEQLSQPKKIPPAMSASYKRLVAANPKTRLPVADFLDQGRRTRSFFDTPLIHISEFVENMGVKDQSEREAFLDELERTGEQFPKSFIKVKILPELLKTVEFGGGGPTVFSAVLKIGEKLCEEEWEGSITPVVVRLFSLPDRATRVFLLDNLEKMIDHLSKRIVNDKIFPDMVTGFSDTAPIVREQTVKAVLTIVPKLSDKNINGTLLRCLAKTQNDEQPGIRTNTTICLGKIARNLGQNTRQKVLVAAFTRSLRDPFIHARLASLLALSATSDVFDETDCASKVVPAISPSLVDKEKTVRAQAAKTLDIYLARIKTLTANYPDTEAMEPTASSTPQSALSLSSTAIKSGHVEGAEGWAGWAISSFTKKIASTAVSGDMSSFASLGPRSASAPPRREAVVLTPVTSPRPSITATTSETISQKPVSGSQPGGFLDDDDDDVGGWGALGDDNTGNNNNNEDEDEDDVDTFFDAPVAQSNPPLKSQHRPLPSSNASSTTTSKGPVKLSTFGPRPFSLPKDEDEIDFDELINSSKKKIGKNNHLPKGLTKKTAIVGRGVGSGVVGGRKMAPVVAKKEEDEDVDWGGDWS